MQAQASYAQGQTDYNGYLQQGITLTPYRARGDGGDDIYLSDADWETWLEVFGQVCERFSWICHAWCQMTNHYHILIEIPEANLVMGMRQLNGVYTQRINRVHERVGHVFQGRYKAILVEQKAVRQMVIAD